MPDKGYRIYLEKGFVIAVSVQMAEGRVVGFVVRLVQIVGEDERDVALRYSSWVAAFGRCFSGGQTTPKAMDESQNVR